MNGFRKITSIDLNCDLGEGMNNDHLIMPFISSANIACGFHAGNEDIIKQTIELCLMYNVSIGAHPGFHDKENFGRNPMHLTEHEYYQLIIDQLEIIDNICMQFDVKLHHVKPHGALYNMAATDRAIAGSIAKAVKDFDDTLVLYGLSGSISIASAAEHNLKIANEVFADRHYNEDGSLVSRKEKNALIDTDEKALQQVLQMINSGTVTTIHHTTIPIQADTICIHGDGKQAVSFAQKIHSTLISNGITIKTCNQ